MQYPESWVQPDNRSLCGNLLKRDLEIGPDSSSVMRCGSDGSVSQVSIDSVIGDQRQNTDYTLRNDDGFGVLQNGDVTADNIDGSMYQGLAKGQGEGVAAYPDGTIVIQDVFYKNYTTYFVKYTQFPPAKNGGPTQDQLSAFNNIVDSLKFK